MYNSEFLLLAKKNWTLKFRTFNFLTLFYVSKMIKVNLPRPQFVWSLAFLWEAPAANGSKRHKNAKDRTKRGGKLLSILLTLRYTF